MRVFKIKEKSVCYGYLFVAQAMDKAYIELIKGNFDYPLFFNEFARKDIYTINCDQTRMWILERVIPYERQNIAAILRENNLKAYNEYEMFILAKGKSSMDGTSLEEISMQDINDQIKERRQLLIQDFILDKSSLIVFFRNGATKMFSLPTEHSDNPFLSEFRDEIIFSQKERYSYVALFNSGKDINFSYDSLKAYLANNLLDASEVASIKGVTRQNISLQKKEGKLHPIKDRYYLKNDVL